MSHGKGRPFLTDVSRCPRSVFCISCVCVHVCVSVCVCVWSVWFCITLVGLIGAGCVCVCGVTACVYFFREVYYVMCA